MKRVGIFWFDIWVVNLLLFEGGWFLLSGVCSMAGMQRKRKRGLDVKIRLLGPRAGATCRKSERRNSSTHRENNDYVTLPFYHHPQVIPHFNAPECFVDEEVADLGCRDEARRGGEEIRWGERASLDAERA